MGNGIPHRPASDDARVGDFRLLPRFPISEDCDDDGSDDNDSDGDNGGSSHVDLGARFDPHMMRVDDAGDISNAELMTSLSSVESDSEDEDVPDTLSEDGTDLGTENDVGQEAAAECTWEGFCVD